MNGNHTTSRYLCSRATLIKCSERKSLDQRTTSGATVNTTLVSGLTNPIGIVVVPEPSTWALLATGAGALLVFRRRKSKGARSCLTPWREV
jgi:hypothetical protein